MPSRTKQFARSESRTELNLECRYRVGIAKWADLVRRVRRAPALAEDALHEGAGANILDVAQHGYAMDLLGLPALLDAVVDEGYKTGGDNYTA